MSVATVHFLFLCSILLSTSNVQALAPLPIPAVSVTVRDDTRDMLRRVGAVISGEKAINNKLPNPRQSVSDDFSKMFADQLIANIDAGNADVMRSSGKFSDLDNDAIAFKAVELNKFDRKVKRTSLAQKKTNADIRAALGDLSMRDWKKE